MGSKDITANSWSVPDNEKFGQIKPHKKDTVILPKFSNHSLRHTFTTRMCEAGVNLKVMQEILGHADAETTMDIYAEATKELKKSELYSFAEFFKRVKELYPDGRN